MSEEIVITYKTETLKVEDFTEREKAIYWSAYNKGFDAGLRKPVGIVAAVCMVLAFGYLILKNTGII